MSESSERQDLEAKLAQCKRLAREFTDGITAKNLRDLMQELELKIQSLGK